MFIYALKGGNIVSTIYISMEKNERIIKLLLASIVVIVIISIIAVILVWKHKFFEAFEEEKVITTMDRPVGVFTYENYTSESALNEYLENINSGLKNADIDLLYSLLSDDYKDYYSYNKEKLYNNLKNKNVLGREFTNVNYSVTSFKNTIIYNVNMATSDNTISFDLILLEKSINDYSFSLDKFIMCDNAEYENSINGVSLKINSRVYFTDRIVEKGKLTNSNNFSVYVNTNNKVEPLYLAGTINGIDSEIETRSTIFSGNTRELLPNSDLEISFDCNTNFTNFNGIRNYVIKGVLYSGSGSSIDLNFEYKK